MKKVFKTMAFTLLGLVLSINLMADTSASIELCTSWNKTLAYATEYTQDYTIDDLNGGTTTMTLGVKGVFRQSNSNTYFQMNKKTGYFKNTTKLPGKITKIETTWDNTATKGATKCYFATNAAASSSDKTVTMTAATSVTYTPPTDADYYYFNIDVSTGSGSAQMTSCKVYYEVAGTPTGKDVTITAESELNLTAEESDGTITVTYGDDVADKEIKLYADAECKTAFSGNWFTADFDASGNVEYIAEANTGAAREAYIQIYVLADDAETNNTKVIKVTQEEYKEPTGTFEKFTGATLKEGDYVICVGTDAMKNSVTSNRLDYASVTVSSDKITNPEASVIWHIAPAAEGNWSIFNTAYDSNKGGYAAGTGTKNQAGILAATTDVSTETKAQWTCAKVTNGYNFENVANSAAEVNSKLQKNGTYGFACYGSFSDITLYKKHVDLAKSAVTFATCTNGSVGATVKSAAITSGALVEEDEVVTLTNTPAEGYKLDVYSVTETGGEKTVTVTDGRFTMTAFPVTVSATFSLSIETPVLSEATGDKNDAINVKVSNYKSDYSYYYTLDGTDPTNASTAYDNETGITINASCTLKVIAYKVDVTSPVASATYNLPLMTMDAIFAKATAVGSTATAVRVKFTDCVVTGVSGDNVYLTDNAGKGLIIYQSSHGFAVNDKLNGVVNVQLLLYRGSSEIKGLTSSTDGLTVTKDGSVSPITTMSIASLSGVNTGAVLSYTNLIYDNGYFSDGENTIQPYNTFKIADYPDFADGDKYNVTGVYIQYNTTKEIAPRSLDDLEKIEAQKYAINLANVEHGTIATDPETEAADGIPVTLTADPENGYMLEAYDVYKTDEPATKVTVANGKFTMPAYDVTVSATFVELPIWATTYTSNVTIGTDKVKLAEAYQPADYPEDGYDAKKTGSSSASGSTTITVPAGTYAIHFHAAGWNSENVTLAVKKGGTELGSFDLPKDEGMTGNSPFTLANDPAMEEYFMVNLSDITEETTITFAATSGKRFAIYGVNALAPAAITIDPTSKNFGEVKANSSSEPFEFTIDPNDFVEGTPEIEIIGEDAAWFSYTAITGNAFTVTFSPEDEKEVCSATLNIKLGNEVMCSASLTGKAISATTPEILVPAEPVDFGTVLQGQSFEPQEVYVTLNNLIGVATIDVTGNFEVTPATLNESGNVIVSVKSTETAGSYEGKLTISSDGATSKEVSLKAQVADKWAYTFTSNVKMSKYGDGEVSEASVVIDEKEYEGGAKAGTSSKTGVIAVTLPEGAHTLHFHAVGWNNKTVKIMLSSTGEATISAVGPYTLVGEATGNSPFTLSTADNCALNEYYTITLSGEVKEGDKILFSKVVDGSDDNRFVLYGVNQEGGISTVLQSIEIQGTATALNYEIGQTFVPTGLKVVGTFKKGEEEPTYRDLTNAEFDWSFDPAIFTSTEQTSVVVTATAKENTEITASKTIENIVVTAPVVEISTETEKVDFGTVAQDATVNNELVYITFKNCTEASVALSGDDAAKFTINENKVEAGEFNWVTVGVAEGTTATAGEYKTTLKIHADGAIADIVLPVTLIVEAPESCDQADDFATVDAVSSYGNRTTTAGWTATYTRVDVVDDYTYFTMNGKTTAAGVITSPVLSHGISTLKFRYGNIAANDTKYKVQIDIKQGEDIVKTYEVSKEGISKGDIFTETITNINVAGDYQIIFTNKCPSESSSNADRAAIGRLCITEFADYVRSELTIGNYGTICLPNAVNVGDYSGAEFYSIVGYQGAKENPSGIVIESVVDELVAGMPYIFKATANQITVTYKGGAVTAPVTNDNKAAANGLIGSFEETKLNAGYYGIQNNALVKVVDADVWVDANRAYIDMEYMSSDDDAPAPAPGVRRVAMSNSSYSAPTDLNTLNSNVKVQKVMKNGQLYIIRDTKMYNAQGQLVK